MTKTAKIAVDLGQILQDAEAIRKALAEIADDFGTAAAPAATADRFVKSSGALIDELRRVRERVSPVRFGSIDITLGRSDSIAKFFAFSFVSQRKRKLGELIGAPFYGSGVYAIYYHGKKEKAYQPLSGQETPIYVGTEDPRDRYAESIEGQGKVLHARFKEHAKSIARNTLDLSDFYYRSAAIQSGMQAAVEAFIIHLFRVIWNKEIKVCYGIGKHGDSAATRANKRSPWDTMHPGRKWAANTKEDQMKRVEIEAKISQHFQLHPVIPNQDALLKLLSLGSDESEPI